jgi:P2 family phage contractile tail tube protein
MQVPEKLINYRLYNDGNDLLGVADLELPDIEWMTETISGAGIAGEVDSPVLGHFKSLSLKLKWRTVTEKAAELARSKAHHFDCRGSIQRYDAGEGEYRNYPVKCVVKGIPKKVGLGKFEPGKPQDGESEFECVYLKLWIDGKEMIEIDKYNFIAVVDGVDYLADTRGHLGLG